MTTTAATSTPLSQMLNNAFSKFDRDGDDKLNSQEFANFNEVLKPGIAVDETGKPTVDMKDRMDHDSDGFVDREEMNTTGVLMPSGLCDPGLKSMLSYLQLQTGASALQAAKILEESLSDTL
jgi:Ca2+-binding EF-hand superfamily protein